MVNPEQNDGEKPFVLKKSPSVKDEPLVGDVKYLSFKILIKPRNTLAGKKSLQGKLAGNGYLIKQGENVSGFLVFGKHSLIANGRIVVGDKRNKILELSAKGTLRGKDIQISFSGSYGKENIKGDFVVHNETDNSIFTGEFRDTNILFQENDGGKTGPEDDCGKIIPPTFEVGADFVTGVPVKYRIEIYENCIKIIFLDATKPITVPVDPNNPNGPKITIYPQLEGSTVVVMKKDPRHVTTLPGGQTISVFDGIFKGKVSGHPGKGPSGQDMDGSGYGEFKMIMVNGCADLKFFQFIKQTDTVDQPPRGNPAKLDRGWKGDPENPAKPGEAKPYPFPFDPKHHGLPGKGFIDDPGDFGPLPEGPAQGGRYPDDTILKLQFDFETYVCCDGNLISLITWGYTVTYIVKATGHSDPVVSTKDPQTKDPNTNPGENQSKVKCS